MSLIVAALAKSRSLAAATPPPGNGELVPPAPGQAAAPGSPDAAALPAATVAGRSVKRRAPKPSIVRIAVLAAVPISLASVTMWWFLRTELASAVALRPTLPKRIPPPAALAPPPANATEPVAESAAPATPSPTAAVSFAERTPAAAPVPAPAAAPLPAIATAAAVEAQPAAPATAVATPTAALPIAEPTPAPPPPSPELEEKVRTLVIGAASAGTNQRVIVAGRVFLPGELVVAGLFLQEVYPGLIVFRDKDGNLYTRRF